MPELGRQSFQEIMDRVYRTGERFVSGDAAVRLLSAGKQEAIYLNLTIEALRDDNKLINGVIAVAADVTEQMLARQELEKVSDTLRLAMDSSNMGFYRIMVATDKLEVSPRARMIHAIPLDVDLSYSNTLGLIVPEHRERFRHVIATAIATKGGFNEDYQIQPLDGSKKRWLNSTGKAELNKQGDVVSVVGTIFDITESKEDEQRKNDFIGMVSHELKTPLTSLQGFAQLGSRNAQKTDDAYNTSLFERVGQQVRKMNGLINGFLNVSQMESGKIHLNISDFRMDELLKESVKETQMLASGQQFELRCAPISVSADREKIGTVITNLLSNTVKYAKNKKVTVCCQTEGNNALVSVKDEGAGIKPNDLDKLFERYYRVEGNNQNISGFGIGLYLCSEIIKRHNGKIWAESKPGEGATFLFSVPLQAIN